MAGNSDRSAGARPPESGDGNGKHRHIVLLGVFAGVLLFIIGVRFMAVPPSAVYTFGLANAPAESFGLHYVIGLRDLWLGALAVIFAAWREWRALALWLFLAVPVCWADAAIVATHGGPRLAVAFHVGSGIFCLVLALAAWRRVPRSPL